MNLRCIVDTENTTTVQFKYTSSDILHIGLFYWASRPLHTFSRTWAILLIGSALCFSFTENWSFVVTSLALAAVLWWMNWIHAFRRWLAFKLNPDLFDEPFEVTLNGAGVYAKAGARESRLQWTAYKRVLESDRMFLLFYGKKVCQSIPKRAFADEEEIGVVRELLKQNIKETS